MIWQEVQEVAERLSADSLLCDSLWARISRGNDLGLGLICRASLTLSSVMHVYVCGAVGGGCCVHTQAHLLSLPLQGAASSCWRGASWMPVTG